MKKFLIGMFVIIFISITFMQYSENLKLRREPPSSRWGKEVLITSDNITDYPQLIKYRDHYIVAYTDGTTINVLAVDKFGKRMSKKSFLAEGDMARNIHVVTDENNINLSWIITEKNINVMLSKVLDKDFDKVNESRIENIKDLKQVGNDLLIVSLKDKIKVIDFKNGKDSDVEAPLNDLVCGTRAGDRYIVAFLNENNNFTYFLVKDGVPGERKEVGALKGTSRVLYYNTSVSIDGDKGYILSEYRYQSMYGGSKIIEFALDGSSYNVTEISDKDRVISVYNITSFTATDKNDTGIKFIAGGYRPLGKKESYEDVLELEANNGVIAKSIPMSRTRAMSGFPSGYEDTVVFCDVVDYDYSNLYMTSYREDFKNVSNNNRGNEYVLAFLDTSQGILFTFVYLVVFGSIWIIPSFLSAALLTLFEYKFNDSKRKVIFIFAYIAAVALKSFVIYSIVFKRLKYYLPLYLTSSIGIGAGLIISIVCCVYCYRRYIDNLQKNTIAASISPLFILDSWFTLFLFIPFIK